MSAQSAARAPRVERPRAVPREPPDRVARLVLRRRTVNASAAPRRAALAALTERYLSLDPRALALFRVYFGLLLFADVLRRIPLAGLYYSNEGVLPNHYALYAPLSARPFSLLFTLSSSTEVKVAFLAMAACHLALALGLFTRVMQVLAILFTVSINQRNPLLENGGCVVLVILAVWTAFLPLGATMSVDSLRARDGGAPAAPPTRVVSVVALGLLLQTAAIYFFNGVQKDGADWRTGTVIHYLLWQDRLATPLAGWLRHHEPAWLSPALTRATLWLEIGSPVLLFFPAWWQRLRALHVGAMIAFHLSIAALCNLGPFSWAMVGLNLLLLPPAAMDALAARSSAVVERARAVVGAVADALGPSAIAPPRPASQARWALREGSALLLLAAMMLQVAHENPWLERWLPASLRSGPGWLTPVIEYGRIGQGWFMFAEAPRDDGRLVVDAITVGGRRVDPLTGREPDFDVRFRGPSGMSQLDCDYQLKISWSSNGRYRGELAEYLKRWHDVARRPPEDKLASFRAYWVTHRSPPPGHFVPFGAERALLVTSE